MILSKETAAVNDEISREEYQFRRDVIEGLAELRNESKNIVGRLDTLNGSVARHERYISGAQARSENSRDWRKALQPYLMLLVGAVLTLILLNGQAILGIHK